MKVSLVVASGVHQGKVIPIVGPQFLIGRDPECQLRPASQAVSKQHCAVIVRDGKVYLQDFGSTNGTLLNDVIVKGEERLVENNASLKIGPLDFTVRIELTAPKADGTPLPDLNAEGAAALAAVKAAAGSQPASKNATPAPKSLAKQPPPVNATPPTAPTEEEAEHDRLAAMLLGLDEGEVPGGSTVVDVALPPELSGATAADAAKKDDKAARKTAPSGEEMSSAASEILRRYMRRPR